MELPTRNVAGSPTRVSMPAELEMIAVSTMGPTKSISRAIATRMIIGASSTTVVALGSTAHKGATRIINPQQEPFAVSSCGPQIDGAEQIKNTGRNKSACYYQTAKQQSDGSICSPINLNDIPRVKNPQHDQRAYPH